jgi:hypothetical protein
MGNAIAQIRAQVSGMLTATRHVLEAVQAQLRSGYAGNGADVLWLLETLRRTFGSHAEELAGHLKRLGASPADAGDTGSLAVDLVDTAVRKIAPEGGANALRDYYTALSLLHAGALMLETNARALGFSSTAALATRHREEISTLMARIREALPGAIKGEIDVQARERTA